MLCIRDKLQNKRHKLVENKKIKNNIPTQLKKWAKDLNKHLTEENIQMVGK